MNNPEVSVVMGVYNEEDNLKATIQSVLEQSGVSLEFIIVNDGSTDKSESIIREFMQIDSRIVLLNQENNGLTAALIHGCSHASSNYIARQDSGDISLPERLVAQKTLLDSDTSIALCSTGVLFLAPDGETLYKEIQSRKDSREGLKGLSIETIKGPPHHGSVMFRTDTYLKAGGYRKQFYVAQDLDLWTRMIEYGSHQSLQNIYYHAAIDVDSISTLNRDQQIATANIIFECCRARTEDGNDSHLLELAQATSSKESTSSILASKISRSKFMYFIGSNLHETAPEASRKYLLRALVSNPFNWKALIKILTL